MRYPRLVAVSIPPGMVDRAKDRPGMIGVHEGTWAVIHRLTGDRHVVGIHNPMDEANLHPARDEIRLSRNDSIEKGPVRLLCSGCLWVVPSNHIVRENAQGLGIISRRKELKGADPHMAAGNPSQYRAWEDRLADDPLAGRDRRKGARGRDTQRGHCFADDVLAQNRTKHGSAVTQP